MTIKEAIQRVLSLYQKGVQSVDARLSRRHIWNKLITVRERVIVQEFKKNQKISQWSYQTLPCIEMIQVPIIECPCVPPLGMMILRSKNPLPAAMTGMDDHIIQSIMSLDGSEKYDPTEWESLKYAAGNKYTANKIEYFIKGEYLYLTATKAPLKVTASALAADPIKWYLFGSCCEQAPCFNVLDKEFPIEGDLFEAVVELASLELIDAFNKQREDKSSNTSDDTGAG